MDRRAVLARAVAWPSEERQHGLNGDTASPAEVSMSNLYRTRICMKIIGVGLVILIVIAIAVVLRGER